MHTGGNNNYLCFNHLQGTYEPKARRTFCARKRRNYCYLIGMEIGYSAPSHGDGKELHKGCMKAFICVCWIAYKYLHSSKVQFWVYSASEGQRSFVCACVRLSPIMKPISLYGSTQELMKATHKQMYSFWVLSGCTHMNRLRGKT